MHKEPQKVFLVMEARAGRKWIVHPKIIKKDTDFVKKLLASGGFEEITVSEPSMIYNFFASEVRAADYMDELFEHLPEEVENGKV